MMRRGVLVIAILALTACGQPDSSGDGALLAPYATGEMASFKPVADGGAPPDLALVGEDGQAQTLADLTGEKATLVNLWATWCAPCIEEMPDLNTLQEDYGDDGLRVVAVNLDRNAGLGLDFYESEGIDALGFHHDPELAAPSLYNAQGVPLTVVYDAGGRELGRVEGAPIWTSPEARALVEAAMAAADVPAAP